MLFKSQLASTLSGSLGGFVASHNRGGAYFRARTIPIDPNTPKQAAVRASVALLVSLWSSVITAAQRTAWGVYAANVPLIGPLGDSRPVSALNHFVRSNVPRSQGGLPLRFSPPTIFNLGDFAAPEYNIPGTITAEVFFDPFDDWVEENLAGMLIWASRPQNASINYFKGPYQFAHTVPGSVGSPPISPSGFTLPFPCPLGDRCFFRTRVTRQDARLSADTRAFFQN